jgi:hypothetical protein
MDMPQLSSTYGRSTTDDASRRATTVTLVEHDLSNIIKIRVTGTFTGCCRLVTLILGHIMDGVTVVGTRRDR